MAISIYQIFDFVIIGPEAPTVPLDYATLHVLIPRLGETLISRSMSSRNPYLLCSLMGSVDPFGGFVPTFDQAGPGLLAPLA